MSKSLSLRNTVKNILIEQSEGEFYKISPEEFTELMKFGGYHGKAVTKLKMFEGKPIWITGDLDLSNTPTDSLGNVKYVEGRLDISKTNISDLSGVKVKGYIWDGGTPIEKKRLAAILKEKMEEADERRQRDEWSIEGGDEIGLRAQALFKNLINDEKIFAITGEDIGRLEGLRADLEELNNRYSETEGEDDDLLRQINDIEENIREIQQNSADVYNIVPMKYNYYGLPQFEVIGVGDLEGEEYAVGDESEMDDAALEYAKNYIDEAGIEGFRDHFIEYHLDTDAIEQYFRDFYDDDVRYNIDVYFNESELPDSEEQEQRKQELEEYIEKVEIVIKRLKEKQERLKDEIKDPDEYTKQYNEIQSRIDIIQGHIDDSQEEIDNMEPEGEPTEDMIEEKIEEMVSEKMDDPRSSLSEFGMDISEYVDMDSLAAGLVASDGYGILGSYDGSYDAEMIDNKYYYILRIN
jgi:predicted  nucleic acid-binding Zn-ribbon protein